ncbi:hypothetical protein M1O56_00005, partial [Dehalococcoidia bacterium]|nr:hypothetical protein [Dehalococcoidia bacterium]
YNKSCGYRPLGDKPVNCPHKPLAGLPIDISSSEPLGSGVTETVGMVNQKPSRVLTGEALLV